MESPATPPGGADFDPLDEHFKADPHPTWSELRERCPVARGARWDFWALTKYDDVRAASRRPATFTSRFGVVVPSNPVSGRRAPLHFDPPEHPRYRRPLNAVLGADRVAALEPRLRAFASDLVRSFVADGGGDLVSRVSSPFTGLAFSLFIGLPEAEAREVTTHSERFEHAQAAFDADTAERENQYLYDFCRRLVRQRRAAPLDPGQDVVSALQAVRIDGELLDDEFVAGSVRQLLIAAHVAPTVAIASAVRHLAGDPKLQQHLRDRPGLIPDAVEELLRLYTPNQGFARTATEDTEVRGQQIREGEQVALALTSANRDAETFECPHEFVLGRDPNPHIAFGHGAHKCPGATAARAELRIVLEELLGQTRTFEPAGHVVPTGWPLYGPDVLPIRCSAAS